MFLVFRYENRLRTDLKLRNAEDLQYVEEVDLTGIGLFFQKINRFRRFVFRWVLGYSFLSAFRLDFSPLSAKFEYFRNESPGTEKIAERIRKNVSARRCRQVEKGVREIGKREKGEQQHRRNGGGPAYYLIGKVGISP